MNKQERAFNKKVKELIKAANASEDQAVVKAVTLLSEARKNVAATIAQTDWQAYNLPQMKAAIDRALAEFGGKLGVELHDTQSDFWQQGVNLVDEPLRVVGVSAIIPAIDTQALTAMQTYSRHLVKSLGEDAAAKIYNEMSLGIMGQKTPFEVMEAVGKNLKDASIFKSIAARAETIVSTECGRALAAASQERMEAAAGVVPGLKKKWIHGAAPRRQPRFTHMGIDGQVRDVNKPFNVGGEALMFPRDPAGSARNTVNCKCYSAPFMEAWAKNKQGGFSHEEKIVGFDHGEASGSIGWKRLRQNDA